MGKFMSSAFIAILLAGCVTAMRIGHSSNDSSEEDEEGHANGHGHGHHGHHGHGHHKGRGYHSYHHNPVELFAHPSKDFYNAGMRPNASGAPTEILVNMYIRQVSQICKMKNTLKLDLTLRQQYKDERLAFDGENHVSLIGDDVKKIWTPDTFVRQELSGFVHDILKPNVYARVQPDGEILLSQRVLIEIPCMVEDMMTNGGQAECKFQLASYGLKNTELSYKWKETNPIQAAPIYHTSVALKEYTHSRCDVVTSTGHYDCLSVDFVLTK